jgi:hypothetical protein
LSRIIAAADRLPALAIDLVSRRVAVTIARATVAV